MNENRNDRVDEPRDTKQPYTQPQLVKHGKVEDQTHTGTGPIGNTSRPPITPNPT